MDLHASGAAASGHLTYCTNIHAAEHFDEMERGLKAHLPAIKAAVSPLSPMGVGLRVAASAAQALTQSESMERLQALLGDDFYVFTFNGFPYGTFHGQRVKDGAYAPDWTTSERLSYTNLLATELAQLLPQGMQGSVSTVPGTYKPWLGTDASDRIERIAEHLIQHVAHLVAIYQNDGKVITLALEPEPSCLLETVEEAVSFFNGTLFSSAAIARLVQLTGLGHGEAESALRRHLTICYDVCHAAVEFEDPRQSIASLTDAGIGVGKLQLSSALKLPVATQHSVEALRPFDEPVYLHQTVERLEGGLHRFSDLDAAFASVRHREGGEWRSHFHVPVFLAQMEHFATTQDFLREILALHREQPISQHLEVETYTWDVLPEAYRTTDLSSAIARELNWVREQLA